MDSKLIDKLIEQQEQIKAMQENEDSAIKIMKMYEECKKRIEKTIEYIESYINQFNGVYPPVDMRYLDLHKLLGILKGEEK